MASFAEALKRDLARIREKFIAEQEEKAPRRLPVRTGYKPPYGTLFASRNWRVTIREAAYREVQVVLTYHKTTTGETNRYVVAPYEWKYRRTKRGIRKVLYAYDMEDKHIKSFVHTNIRRAVLTDRKFRPKWPILIS